MHSERTNYEERSVLTVPMRNGNTIQTPPFPYTVKVLTVPMRNGNQNERITHGGLCGYVLTVPMRNGNILKYR